MNPAGAAPILQRLQVEIDDLANSFMFNTGFQSSSALAKQMEYALGSLTAFPDFLTDLRAELDGKVTNPRCSHHMLIGWKHSVMSMANHHSTASHSLNYSVDHALSPWHHLYLVQPGARHSAILPVWGCQPACYEQRRSEAKLRGIRFEIFTAIGDKTPRFPLPMNAHRYHSGDRSCMTLSEQDLTYSDINSVEAFPLLDSLHWEILRYCPAPAFFFKVRERLQTDCNLWLVLSREASCLPL